MKGGGGDIEEKSRELAVGWAETYLHFLALPSKHGAFLIQATELCPSARCIKRLVVVLNKRLRGRERKKIVFKKSFREREP